MILSRKAGVHRFRDAVAISISDGSTTYLSPRDAYALSRALNAAAGDCRARSFGDSTFKPFDLEATPDRKAKA